MKPPKKINISTKKQFNTKNKPEKVETAAEKDIKFLSAQKE